MLESLSIIPTDKRFDTPLTQLFEDLWSKVSGKKGGFFDDETEHLYKERGKAMLRKVQNNPGPLERLAVKIKQDLPHYWLSTEDNIILCGKVDWLEYLPDQDAVHIIDFKTGKKRDTSQSLQLPIYHLLVHNVQKRQVAGASYWYLESDGELDEKELPELEQAHEQVLQIAKQVKTARKLEHFKCPQGENGCRACKPLERVISGEAELVGVSGYKQDIYVFSEKEELGDNSEIL